MGVSPSSLYDVVSDDGGGDMDCDDADVMMQQQQLTRTPLTPRIRAYLCAISGHTRLQDVPAWLVSASNTVVGVRHRGTQAALSAGEIASMTDLLNAATRAGRRTDADERRFRMSLKRRYEDAFAAFPPEDASARICEMVDAIVTNNGGMDARLATVVNIVKHGQSPWSVVAASNRVCNAAAFLVGDSVQHMAGRDTSSSSTDILVGNVRREWSGSSAAGSGKRRTFSNNVVIKAFRKYAPAYEWNPELIIEQRIYAYCTFMFMQHITPHVVPLISLSHECSEKAWNRAFPRGHIQIKQHEDDGDVFLPASIVNATIMEGHPGKTMSYGTFIRRTFGYDVRHKAQFPKLDASDDDILIVLWQIMFTVNAFQQVGLSHNDLHNENILITELDTPMLISYGLAMADRSGGARGVLRMDDVPVRFLVRVFDFDRGNKAPTHADDMCIPNPNYTFKAWLEHVLGGRADMPLHPHNDIFYVMMSCRRHFKALKLRAPFVGSVPRGFQVGRYTHVFKPAFILSCCYLDINKETRDVCIDMCTRMHTEFVSVLHQVALRMTAKYGPARTRGGGARRVYDKERYMAPQDRLLL